MDIEKRALEINEALSLLPIDKLEAFKRELMDVLYDENWFSIHNMSY